MKDMWGRSMRVALIVVAAVAVGASLSGGAVGDVLDPGAGAPGDGPTLTEWEPQLVNSSTVDTYQVTIAADDQADGIALVRQRPQITSEVTQRIVVNGSFGSAANPEIVSFQGDDGPQERISKDVFVDSGDVVVTLADEGQGAQQQARVTAITVEFEVESAASPGLYDFSVEMEAQDTTGPQTATFDTLNETGIAQVEVVDATPAGPGDLTLDGVQTASEASQDERSLAVSGTVANPTGSVLAGTAVYGLSEGADPALDGTDLLSQTQNVTVAANGNQTVSFFVDLTARDEAIDTGDDIHHGVAAADSGDNVTAQLTITDGPVEHSTGDGATFNRTTGLIQTAVDISSDGDADVVNVTAAGSPYGENVTVGVDDVRIRGDGTTPAVAWAGPQIPDGAVSPPFTVESTAANVTIDGLRIEPLIPDAGGVEVLGGANHEITNNDIVGTNTGAPGVGIEVRDVSGATVSGNEVANKSHGILFNAVSDGVVATNLVRDNDLDGIRFEGAGSTDVTDNVVRDNDQVGVYLGGSAASNNNITANVVRDNGADGLFAGIGLLFSPSDNRIAGNEVLNNTGIGILLSSTAGANNVLEANNATGNREGAQIGASDTVVLDNNLSGNSNFGVRVTSSGNNVTGNTADANGRDGFNLQSASDNNLTDNRAADNSRDGVWLRDGSNFNTLTDNVATNNGRSGIYLGGFAGFAEDNTLVNNTARGSPYGLWLRNARDNDISESLVENNVEGIEVSERNLYLRSEVGPTSLDTLGNTFTNDTSRNNTWDFVVEAGGGGPGLESAAAPGSHPVTNLDIGSSTGPDTTLSFDAADVELRSVTAPPADPAEATAIGRYVEVRPVTPPPAEPVDVTAIEQHVEATNIAPGAFLNVSVSYDDPGDLGAVEESTLELRRYNGTDWTGVPGSTTDPAVDVVSANVTAFSTFGVFGTAKEGTLDDLNIAGEGSSAVVAEGVAHNVSVNVTNTGQGAGAFDVTLSINSATALGPTQAVQLTVTTGQLQPGDTERVVFEDVTGSFAISTVQYLVGVSTTADTVTGEFRVHPDVNGDGNPARDTNGDGLLDDVNGDGVYSIADVQTLFSFLNGPPVTENPGFFDFSGLGDDRVSIFDVQALFYQLRASH